MNINRRLEAMRERLERSRPCTMTFTMKSGEIIKANPAAAWDIFRSRAREGDVAFVSADRDEYAAAAGIMTVLCRPAPNREISDYE